MHQMLDQSCLTNEHELISRLKAGEREVFGRLLDPYAHRMYVLAYSILHDAQDAEEVVQESSLKAFTRINQLRSSSSFKCWLLQITINEARMRKRHARLHPMLSIDEMQKDLHDESRIVPQFADDCENPEQALRRKELETAFDHACNDLPPKYHKIMQLHFQGDLSNPEIGRTLKLGTPAVKTQLHRARLHLREQLASVLPQTM